MNNKWRETNSYYSERESTSEMKRITNRIKDLLDRRKLEFSRWKHILKEEQILL